MTYIIKKSSGTNAGEMKVQYPCKREDVLYAALAAGHENQYYDFVSYDKLAGVVHFKCTRPVMIDSFDIYVNAIEYSEKNTEVIIKAIEIAGYFRYRNYQKHLDYMLAGISKHLKELLERRLKSL